MQQSTESSYDQVPYPSVPLRQTHPDALSTIAALFGLPATRAQECRVLEIGCANGANLIPMAADLPHSQFVGIDLSAAHIDHGQQLADELGLTNLLLKHMNVMDAGPALGKFDYIIAYGVFSWVPVEVQEKILDTCSKCLTPNGIAFLSYNVLPGWHMRGAVRDMLLYHTRQFDEVGERIEQARAMLKFLSESVPTVVGRLPENKAYGMILAGEQERMARQTDSYLLHELLEEYNAPLYFYQFMERAEQHGLQYLSEAEISTMIGDILPPNVAETIGQIGSDIIRTEQYMDFVRNRMFRQTLLCRQGISLQRTLSAELLHHFYISSPLQPVTEHPSICSDINEKFRGPSGSVVSSANPLNKAALAYLGELWPYAITFEDLLSESRLRALSTASVESDAHILEKMLFKSIAIDLVELQCNAPRYVIRVSDYPQVSSMARLQAKRHEPLTNQRHEAVQMDELGSALALHLDGRQDHTALAAVVKDHTPDARDDNGAIMTLLESRLHEMAHAALLVA